MEASHRKSQERNHGRTGHGTGEDRGGISRGTSRCRIANCLFGVGCIVHRVAPQSLAVFVEDMAVLRRAHLVAMGLVVIMDFLIRRRVLGADEFRRDVRDVVGVVGVDVRGGTSRGAGRPSGSCTRTGSCGSARSVRYRGSMGLQRANMADVRVHDGRGVGEAINAEGLGRLDRHFVVFAFRDEPEFATGEADKGDAVRRLADEARRADEDGIARVARACPEANHFAVVPEGALRRISLLPGDKEETRPRRNNIDTMIVPDVADDFVDA